MVRNILEDGRFKVRAPLEQIKGEAGSRLSGQGVDVVLSDLKDDGVTRAAVAGSYAVYAVTSTSWSASIPRLLHQ